MEELKDIFKKVDTDILIDYGGRLLLAIVILIVGLWLSNKVTGIFKKIMRKRGVDDTLQNFLGDLLNWAFKALIFIMVLSKLGVETTSLVALLGAAGLAVGLALQGSLSNFAGGVLIMIFKPIKVGDLIQAQGELGVVKEIQIFVTKLTSPQNRLIIIPNGALSNGNIVNYSEEGKLRVDLNIGVDYGSDIKHVKDVLMEVMTNHPKVLNEPAPIVNMHELGDSSINFVVRPWATPTDYWDVYFGVMEQGKEALDKAGIEIPYPHQVNIEKK